MSSLKPIINNISGSFYRTTEHWYQHRGCTCLNAMEKPADHLLVAIDHVEYPPQTQDRCTMPFTCYIKHHVAK